MEMVALQSEQQLPRQTLARNESVAAVDEIQGSPSPCHQVDGGDSRDGETSGYSIPFLPELNTPMLPTKFLNLKHLIIQISVATLPPSYDYFSLVSFLDASPSLETWYLEVYPEDMEHESVFEGSSDLRQLPEYRHDNLKSVEIIGFISARSLIELTCCIVKSAVSLKRLTLDTLRGGGRCSGGNGGDCSDQICSAVSKAVVEEAFRGVAAIRKYIEDKVLSTAKLIVLEPCPQCHTTTVLDYSGNVDLASCR